MQISSIQVNPKNPIHDDVAVWLSYKLIESTMYFSLWFMLELQIFNLIMTMNDVVNMTINH